ncbi:MAG: hypothetical protein A4E32_00689 [Methanomassiliicoccales archaeon PtaU1.Bin124]|nr:MAG: hypothetical protein A4E32_00689 [Methanomassiliicoccales archaeon PtaU1.Bin124]
MRPIRTIGLIIIIAGIVLTALAAIEGGVVLSLFLIIPVFEVRSLIGAVGVLLVFAGILVSFFLPFFAGGDEEKGNAAQAINIRSRPSSAGVVLIGPIPIVWRSDNRMALLAMAIALIVMAVMVLLLL